MGAETQMEDRVRALERTLYGEEQTHISGVLKRLEEVESTQRNLGKKGLIAMGFIAGVSWIIKVIFKL